ncbi:MAG: transporter substrate-binding domain-containing protein [Proteobacteria bacterium]|nr:transporter substrate-binding domain-containing protein [Pseudomonadota bacterium]
MNGRMVAIVVLLFLMAGVCYGSEKIVTLATLTDFAPFCFPKENARVTEVETIPPGSDSSQLQGYSWDVVRESFHAMNYSIRLYVVPWERGMHYLAARKVEGIFPANHSVEREKEYAFSKAYVDQVKMVMYVRADSQLTWQGLESLNRLPIGFVRGWSYGKKWEASDLIIKEPTDTIDQGFDLVAKKRLVGVAGYQLPYDYALKKAKRTDSFKIVGHFDTIDEYLMGRKNDQHSLLNLDIFDSGRKRIDENGVFSEIERKWR